jgi:HAD superfamily hydrolase (TIGR01450 family)
MAEVPFFSLDALLAYYSVFLLDAYGVLVTSTGALPGAVELIDRLNREGHDYSILTNDASRLPESCSERYRDLGLDVPAERVITSGSLLGAHFREHELEGKRCAFLGTEDTGRYVELAGGRPVAADEEFEVLVLGDEQVPENSPPFLATVDLLLSGLIRRLDRSEAVHLVQPNPDLLYPKGDGAFGFAVGGVARMFETVLAQRYFGRGLRFIRLGKPHAPMFEEAVRRHGGPGNPGKMVMIGDQLDTDIRGARNFGIDSVLVESRAAPADPGGDRFRKVRPTWRRVLDPQAS